MLGFHFKRNKQASYKRQLITFFAISIFILATCTSVITAWQTSQLVKQSTMKTGFQLTNIFAQQSVLALLTDSKENLQVAIENILGFQSITGVAVFKPNGELLDSLSKDSNVNFYESFLFSLQSRRSINQLPIQLFKELDEMWLFAAPVNYMPDLDDMDTVEPEDTASSKQLMGYVLLEYNKKELHEVQYSIFINNMLISTLIAVILASLMSWWINRLTKPLIDLSHTMKLATNLKHYPRAKVAGAKEIHQIAEVFNLMMASLEEKNTELVNHRDTLESEVGMRTQQLIIARDTALTASRHKSEFLANISHELRTPLQAIIGYTDLVKEDLEIEGMEDQVNDLNKSIRSANNLLDLINNILDIAKIEAGRMDLYLKPVDMVKLVEETIDVVSPIAKANKNKFIVEQQNLDSTLMLDKQKLMQIFVNLLSNACKFTSNGTVTFTIKNNKKHLLFSVSDTGVGIAPDQINLIFDQFTQVDGSQTRRFEGTGLGMAITQNFCELMSGHIKVKSELGLGTKFSIKIPLN